MFVVVYVYLSKVGEEDAVIALFEDWEQTHRDKVQGYISGDLLRNSENSRVFISIMRFESQKSAEAYDTDTKYDGWYQRLTSLLETAPTHTDYISEWRSPSRTETIPTHADQVHEQQAH